MLSPVNKQLTLLVGVKPNGGSGSSSGGTGEQGPVGPKGPKGDKGDTGDAGPQGIQGIPGTNGKNGTNGINGIQGIPGPQGPIGLTGPAGQTTRQSVSSVVLGIGPKTFLFTQTANNIGWAVGTRLRAFIDVDNYMEGIVTSVSSTSVTISSDFFKGSGNGTFWHISITGEKGKDGINGTNGIDGQPGSKGDIGATGLQGPTGFTGPIGPQGIQGLTGPQGPQGIQGLTGPQGPQGIKGDTGATGPMGPQGPAGTSSGVNHFTGLLDVPSAYLGHQSKLLAVNSTATGIEFIPNTSFSQRDKARYSPITDATSWTSVGQVNPRVASSISMYESNDSGYIGWANYASTDNFVRLESFTKKPTLGADFDIVFRIDIHRSRIFPEFIGVYVGNSITGKYVTFGSFQTGQWYYQFWTGTTFVSETSVSSGRDYESTMFAGYLRTKRVGNVLYFNISINGITWITLGSCPISSHVLDLNSCGIFQRPVAGTSSYVLLLGLDTTGPQPI